MSQPNRRYVKAAVEQGVLVLTPSPSRLEGDEMADLLTDEMRSAVADAGAANVVVNLERVEYLTSANFRPLIALRKQLLAAGGRMILCNLCESLLEVFQVTRLVAAGGPSFFETRPDVQSAVAALAGSCQPPGAGSM